MINIFIWLGLLKGRSHYSPVRASVHSVNVVIAFNEFDLNLHACLRVV